MEDRERAGEIDREREIGEREREIERERERERVEDRERAGEIDLCLACGNTAANEGTQI